MREAARFPAGRAPIPDKNPHCAANQKCHSLLLARPPAAPFFRLRFILLIEEDVAFWLRFIILRSLTKLTNKTILLWIEQHFDQKSWNLCDQICQSLLNIKCKSTLMLKVGQIPRPKYGRFHLKIPTLHHTAWLLSRPSIAAPNFLSHPSSQYSPNDHPSYSRLTKKSISHMFALTPSFTTQAMLKLKAAWCLWYILFNSANQWYHKILIIIQQMFYIFCCSGLYEYSNQYSNKRLSLLNCLCRTKAQQIIQYIASTPVQHFIINACLVGYYHERRCDHKCLHRIFNISALFTKKNPI